MKTARRFFFINLRFSRLLEIANSVLDKNVSYCYPQKNEIPRWRIYRGPFLQSPVNFSGPEAIFQKSKPFE